EKLVQYGITTSDHCEFGYGGQESIEHLFFSCPYSKRIRREGLTKCNIQRSGLPWNEELKWANVHMKGKSFPSWLRRVVLGATVYHIWLEKNRRCFNNQFLPEQDIHQKICEDVTGMAATYGPIEDNERNRSLCLATGQLKKKVPSFVTNFVTFLISLFYVLDFVLHVQTTDYLLDTYKYKVTLWGVL
ncbi:hypothetical protein CFOL_v3_22569, partial [Cephalotus follicularis]